MDKPFTSTHCPHLGSGREKEAGLTTRKMEKDSGKRDEGLRIKVMDRGSDSSKGQNCLEGESTWSNSPLEDPWTLMMMMMSLSCRKFLRQVTLTVLQNVISHADVFPFFKKTYTVEP